MFGIGSCVVKKTRSLGGKLIHEHRNFVTYVEQLVVVSILYDRKPFEGKTYMCSFNV